MPHNLDPDVAQANAERMRAATAAHAQARLDITIRKFGAAVCHADPDPFSALTPAELLRLAEKFAAESTARPPRTFWTRLSRAAL